MIITLVEESKEDTRRDNVEGESKDFSEIMIFLYFNLYDEKENFENLKGSDLLDSHILE